jgi:hypothetical protein
MDDKFDEKTDPVVAQQQAEGVDENFYDPQRPVAKFGTRDDQHDMFRMGKDQKFRVRDTIDQFN